MIIRLISSSVLDCSALFLATSITAKTSLQVHDFDPIWVFNDTTAYNYATKYFANKLPSGTVANGALLLFPNTKFT